MKKIIFLFFLVLFVISCKKNNDIEEIYEIDDNVQYFRDINPNLVININDSSYIDIDNNGNNDIRLKFTQGEKWIDHLNDSIKLSIGIFIGSGSSNVDTIAYNEVIDKTQEWYYGFNLFTQDINYIGVKKSVDNQSLFGWIKIDINDSFLIVDSYYFRKEPDVVIRAGIYDYN